jgi:hypothetical protein
MPAARLKNRMAALRKGGQGGRGLRLGAQMGGPVKRPGGPSMGRGPGDRGPGGPAAAVMPDRSRMQSEIAERIQAKRGGGGGAGLPAASAGQPEMAPGAQGPAVMPPEPVAAPIPTGGSGASADVGTGGTGAIDMGPTPKGVQDAGAGGGGRLVRPGTGLIQPAAPNIRPIAGGEAVPAAAPVVAQAAPMARQMAMRQPMSGFRPTRQKPKRGAGRFFTGSAQGVT